MAEIIAGVVRAERHGPFAMRDRFLRISGKGENEAGEGRRVRRAGCQLCGSPGMGSGIRVASFHQHREARRGIGVGIFRIELERPVGMEARLAACGLPIVPPAEAGIEKVHESEHAIERSRGGVEGERLLPAGERPRRILLGHRLAMMRQALHPPGPGLDVAGRGVVHPRLLALGQLDLHFGGENQGDIVLDGEDVIESAVIALRPDMRAAGGIDQLRGDANAVSALADAAFQDISHAELLGRLPHVDRLALVDEAGIAGDDPQPRQLRQGRDNVLDQPVGKEILLLVAGHVGEGQHRDGGCFRGGQRLLRRLR